MGHHSSEDVHEELEILIVILGELWEHNSAHCEARVGPFVIINSFEEQLLKFWVLLNELSCPFVIDHKQLVKLLSSVGGVLPIVRIDSFDFFLVLFHSFCKI